MTHSAVFPVKETAERFISVKVYFNAKAIYMVIAQETQRWIKTA